MTQPFDLFFFVAVPKLQTTPDKAGNDKAINHQTVQPGRGDPPFWQTNDKLVLPHFRSTHPSLRPTLLPKLRHSMPQKGEKSWAML